MLIAAGKPVRRKEVHDRWSAIRIGYRSNVPCRFMQQHIYRWGLPSYGPAINGDDVRRVDLNTQAGNHLAVDGHPSGGYKFLAGAPRGYAGLGQHLLQALR